MLTRQIKPYLREVPIIELGLILDPIMDEDKGDGNVFYVVTKIDDQESFVDVTLVNFNAKAPDGHFTDTKVLSLNSLFKCFRVSEKVRSWMTPKVSGSSGGPFRFVFVHNGDYPSLPRYDFTSNQLVPYRITPITISLRSMLDGEGGEYLFPYSVTPTEA